MPADDSHATTSAAPRISIVAPVLEFRNGESNGWKDNIDVAFVTSATCSSLSPLASAPTTLLIHIPINLYSFTFQASDIWQKSCSSSPSTLNESMGASTDCVAGNQLAASVSIDWCRACTLLKRRNSFHILPLTSASAIPSSPSHIHRHLLL